MKQLDFELLPMEEQETTISRVRDEGNLVNIYTSDRRVMQKIIDSGLAVYRIHCNSQTKKVTAIECTLELKEFKKCTFLPTYRGKN